MTQVILVSQFPLPYSKIGSWTTMYGSYLEKKHKIDYIVCTRPEDQFNSVKYSFVEENFISKLKKNIFSEQYLGYIKALESVLIPDNKYIIQIVDNFGVIKPLQEFLTRKGFRQNCQIQFFYHGFPPFFENFNGRWFYDAIDEMVLLTYDSYKIHKEYYTILPCSFSVLHNGIDTGRFYRIEQKERQILKNELNLLDKKVFLWCSKDLPKKGLDFILRVWKKIYSRDKSVMLLVVGATREVEVEGVQYLGEISNNELPKYYQLSDCYLFPTLCHEGCGLSLIEALHCGCYCIASALGGVPEVLQYGKYGKLVEKPHFEEDWEKAILEFLYQSNNKTEIIPSDLYSAKAWSAGMDKIIDNAKFKME